MTRFGIAFLIVALLGVVALGQEPILSFSADPPVVRIAPGGEATVRVVAANNSVHPGDDLTIEVSAPDGLVVTPAKGSIKEIAPFGKGEIEFTVSAASGLAPLTYTLTLSILYTYCIEVSCFQIADEITIPVTVTTTAAGPVHHEVVRRSLPAWVIPGIGLLLLGVGIGLWASGFRLPLYFVLLVFVVGGFVYGIRLGQHEQAQGIGAVLCTSCVGIEAVQHAPPRLSPAARAALGRIDHEVELVVFYAPWCHTCPFAEEMVKAAAQVNPRISYKFVNVDTDREIAAAHGVIRNQRTIVPAILRADTGAVIFGIRNLEPRLLELLGVGG